MTKEKGTKPLKQPAVISSFKDGLFLGSPIGYWIAFVFWITTTLMIYFS